ncbi:MAG: hypothetical protein J5859_06140 [Clostridia bacterium]|nr:hypothetical protein [Clostridia bacterium]
MIKKTLAGLILASLCLLLLLPAAFSETREGVIALEGEEEIIEETLFESPLGFSFWYANETLEAYYGEADNIEGVVVATLYSDDYMVLSMITEEEAAEYTEDLDEDIAEQSAAARVQTELYCELEAGRYCFCTLIAENGQYFRAVGEYAEEAAEGNAKYFRRVLDSVTFSSGCLIRAEWGEPSSDEEDTAEVILTALEPVRNVVLLSLTWEDFTVSWEPCAALGDLSAQQSVSVDLEFIGDMPDNGILYTDKDGITHAYALDISGEDGQLLLWNMEE